MPPRRFSRYTFAIATPDIETGALMLYGDEPFRYRDLNDNREHIVRRGDTLFTIAARYFRGLSRPAGLWWIVADFQPDPIHDPTLELDEGRVLSIPSLETVQTVIFSQNRRWE